MSDLLSPLTELTKTSKYPSFQWSSAAQSAFESVKAAVLQSQSLSHFSDDDDTFIFCDASTIGIGATLMQRQNGVMVPICFLSQKFLMLLLNGQLLSKSVMPSCMQLLGRGGAIVAPLRTYRCTLF